MIKHCRCTKKLYGYCQCDILNTKEPIVDEVIIKQGNCVCGYSLEDCPEVPAEYCLYKHPNTEERERQHKETLRDVRAFQLLLSFLSESSQQVWFVNHINYDDMIKKAYEIADKFGEYANDNG